jgi:hypothetical protein
MLGRIIQHSSLCNYANIEFETNWEADAADNLQKTDSVTNRIIYYALNSLTYRISDWLGNKID